MLSLAKRRLPPASTRAYAVSVKPAKALAGKEYPRVFPDRKAFQFNWYTRMLNEAQTKPLIIFHREDFTAERLRKLRADLHTTTQKIKRPATLPSLSDPTPAPAEPYPAPTLTVVRSSIFGAALRDYANFTSTDMAMLDRMTDDVHGGYAVLSFPELSPPYLAGVLRALERAVPPPPPVAPVDPKQPKKDPTHPGRKEKRFKPILTPTLRVVGGIVEGRVLLADSVKEVGKLPTLDVLRSQIVGLLSAPGMQLAGVLNSAAGGQLARTLEGYKLSLEEEQNGGEKPADS